MDDLNVKDGSLDKVRINALHQLAQLPCAPLVAMHDVSRVTLGKHLGLEVEEDQVDGEMDDLDRRLARKQTFSYILLPAVVIMNTSRTCAISVQTTGCHCRIRVIRRREIRL
jgi:histone deacetylase 1/2